MNNTIPTHIFNQSYTDNHLDHVAFPLGGMGAGMLCLEGNGALSQVSLKNRPDLFNEPMIFAALSVRGSPPVAKVLQGPTPSWKIHGLPNSGDGHADKPYGLPHFAHAEFLPRFPFAHITLRADDAPLGVEVCGWSPFIPGDADNSSLPVAALEYRFLNRSDRALDLIFSFHAVNFMAVPHPFAYRSTHSVRPIDGGFVLAEEGTVDHPWTQGAFAAAVDDSRTVVNCAWFRGAHHLQPVWDSIAQGRMIASAGHPDGGPGGGGSLYVPLMLKPGERVTLPLRFSWYCPRSNVRIPDDGQPLTRENSYVPWYAGRFADVAAMNRYWRDHYRELRDKTQCFSDCLYDMTLPNEVIEAVTANLCIFKSPTVLRQTDGRFYAFEGAGDTEGSCPGTCNHVWNYAQAMPHLFPALERGLREMEAFINQDETGRQVSRASLPIRPPKTPRFHGRGCVDGQLGHMVKVYREWRINGNIVWLRSLWPCMQKSMDYCIRTWDPQRQGYLIGSQATTYDNTFWGPNSMCTSFYLVALSAMVHMGEALGADTTGYANLLANGRAYMENELFNGEYFFQKIEWQGITPGPLEEKNGTSSAYRPEGLTLLEREGPIYQYGFGCFADGVVGEWMAFVCGLPPVLDQQKVSHHLTSVFRNNFFPDLSLSGHANLGRHFACGTDGGLILCTWPQGGELSQPFNYAGEQWTGIEYAVASHLIRLGRLEEGLRIVHAVRSRHDGRVRNPFDEHEAGHWYARALSSYALLQALTGIRYDAVEQTLYIAPRIPGDFRAFLATATGFGTAGIKDGQPFLEVKAGSIPVERITCRHQG